MGDSEIIAGLGTRASWVKGAPDLVQRVSSAEEKALASAIGPAGAQLRDVLANCGLAEAKAIAALLGMRLRGLVQPSKPPAGFVPKAPPPPPKLAVNAAAKAGQPVRPAAFASAPPISRPSSSPSSRPSGPAPAPRSRPSDAAAMGEAVDLDEARKKEILALEARLETDSLFALLGVAPGAAAADCKKAYYELTKRFHPDRYFGKNLGSFKARIETIFRKLTEAQAVLSDAARRAEYLKVHPEAAAPAASALFESSEPAVDPQLAAQRAAERRARLFKHPYLAKQGKLHEIIARAGDALKMGEFGKATADLALAAQIDPKNREVLELTAKAKKGGDKKKAEAEFKAACEAENMSDRLGAVSHFRTAVSLDPENAEYNYRAGHLLFARGGESEVKEAHALLRRATELAPGKVEYHLAFAKLLSHAGLEKNALREYEVVLKLDPDHAAAKEQARKLKWKF